MHLTAIGPQVAAGCHAPPKKTSHAGRPSSGAGFNIETGGAYVPETKQYQKKRKKKKQKSPNKTLKLKVKKKK